MLTLEPLRSGRSHNWGADAWCSKRSPFLPCWHHICPMVWILTAQRQIQLSAHASGRAAEDVPAVWAPRPLVWTPDTHVEDPEALGFHLGQHCLLQLSGGVNQQMGYLSLPPPPPTFPPSLPLSFSLCLYVCVHVPFCNCDFQKKSFKTRKSPSFKVN